MIKHGKISDILNTTLSVHLSSPDSGNGKVTPRLLLLKNNHMYDNHMTANVKINGHTPAQVYPAES